MMLRTQRAEITEYYIYQRLAQHSTIPKNRKLLQQIAADEKRHYAYWKSHTEQDVSPNKIMIWWYVFLSNTFGATFALQLRERGEKSAQKKYARLFHIKGVRHLIEDEEKHERLLISMLKDERLEYAGAVVLGLNDALVELTGVLAGLTFALRSSTLVAMVGLITGIAAAMSMTASGYFQAKENSEVSPTKSALYTGGAYLIVVIMLISPYLLLDNLYLSLAFSLILALLIIAGYTYYITTAKKQAFIGRFIEMVIISMGVAVISFIIGWLLNRYVGSTI